MSVVTFAAVFVVIVGGAFGFLFFYEPRIDGDYVGWAQDLPMGATGELRVSLRDQGGSLSGLVTLPAVMPEGGGLVQGVRREKDIVFVTTDNTGRKMTWTASTSPQKMSGYYWWGDLSDRQRFEAEPLGAWSVYGVKAPR